LEIRSVLIGLNEFDKGETRNLVYGTYIKESILQKRSRSSHKSTAAESAVTNCGKRKLLFKHLTVVKYNFHLRAEGLEKSDNNTHYIRHTRGGNLELFQPCSLFYNRAVKTDVNHIHAVEIVALNEVNSFGFTVNLRLDFRKSLGLGKIPDEIISGATWNNTELYVRIAGSGIGNLSDFFKLTAKSRLDV
jgi:hypothetical protein